MVLLLILSQGVLETAALGRRLLCSGGAAEAGAVVASACHAASSLTDAGCGAVSCSMGGDGPCCCHGSSAPAKFAGLVLSPPGCRGGAAPYLPPYPASIEYRFLRPIEVSVKAPALVTAPLLTAPVTVSDFISEIPTPPPRLA